MIKEENDTDLLKASYLDNPRRPADYGIFMNERRDGLFRIEK